MGIGLRKFQMEYNKKTAWHEKETQSATEYTQHIPGNVGGYVKIILDNDSQDERPSGSERSERPGKQDAGQKKKWYFETSAVT